jgi:peptide/nickel transport system substrate-binding protein
LRDDFDKLLIEARAELDETEAPRPLPPDGDDGARRRRLILPMFNDFINGATGNVQGYVHDIGNDMSNGYVATRVWLSN